MKIVSLTQTEKLPNKAAETNAIVVYISGNIPDISHEIRQSIVIPQTTSKISYLHQGYTVFEVSDRDLSLPVFHFVAKEIALAVVRAKNSELFVFNDDNIRRVGYFVWQLELMRYVYKPPKTSPFYNELAQVFSYPIPCPLQIFVSIYKIAPLCYHTAVDFGQFEISFGKAKNSEEGCYFIVSKENTAYKFLRQQFVGLCHKTPDELIAILEKYEREWKSCTYKLITHNCNDFCVQLLKGLDLSCMLMEVTRLSSFARKIVRV